MGDAPCGPCWSRLAPAPDLPLPDDVDDAVSLFAYEGEGRRLVARLKFHNHRDALGSLAGELSTFVGERPDVVTWVPTTPQRRRRRGFDQAQLLAEVLARRLGTPAAPLLRRVRGPAQTGQSLTGRRATGFVARRSVPPMVLVVDDVRTSGASLAAAARTLKSNGARVVTAATLAATPVRTAGREPGLGPLP